MDFPLKFKKSAIKDIQKLPQDSAKEILLKIRTKLPSEALSQKQLSGKFKGLRRYRVGNYRVIFTIIDDEVIILRIANRKDVYKK